MLEVPSDLIRRLRAAHHIAVLTGAGVSAESGIPTFRDAQVGLWAQYRPEDLATPQAFVRNPKLVWEWYAWRRDRVSQARPNPGHYALVEMQRRVAQFSLITQNVDGLHQRAGSVEVIELHGNITRVKCSREGSVIDHWAEAEEIPRCPRCQAYLRPDVVWFGEMLPPEALSAANAAANTCEIFFSIGTSSLVEPAASLARIASHQGAVIVEVNPTATPLTPQATFALPGSSGEVLPALIEAVWPG